MLWRGVVAALRVAVQACPAQVAAFHMQIWPLLSRDDVVGGGADDGAAVELEPADWFLGDDLGSELSPCPGAAFAPVVRHG